MEATSDDAQTTHSATIPMADALSDTTQPGSNLASHGGSSTSLPEKSSLLSAISARPSQAQATAILPVSSAKGLNPVTTMSNRKVSGNKSSSSLAYVNSKAVDQNASFSLNRFVLYETKRRFYIVGSNSSDTRHRVLKVDRTTQDELIVTEDEGVYNERQLNELLRMLEDGNKGSGGLARVGVFFGIAGMNNTSPNIPR